MAKDNELLIKINGDIEGYKAALKAAARQTEDLQTLLNQIAQVGAIEFAGFGTAVIFATARFAQFDHELRGVKTLLDETSFGAEGLEEGFREMSKGALAALREFPLELQSLNKSLFDIVSAGVPAAESIAFLGSTSRLAVAGLTSSAIATDAVTTAVNAYGLSASQAEIVAAKFFTAQKFGKTTIAELSTFMGEAVSTAVSFGVSLDELLASTAAATSGGIKTTQAFTSLNAILSNIAKPTEAAKDEAERLGREFNSTAIRTKGLTGFLKDLTEAEGFNAQSAEKLFGSTEALKVVFALTGTGAEKYKQTLDALNDSQKVLATFTEAYRVQNESLNNQTIILKNNFDALGIAVGSNLAPSLKIITGAVTDFLGFVQDHPGLTTFVSKILIAGTVTGALATTIGVAGLAILKLRAAMVASAAATTGMSLATKALVGSTGIGLLIAFLPEIIELLDGSLVPALAFTAAGLFKTRSAMLAATTSTKGLAIAVKGLIGSTGIGLLIVFLPEIIEALQKFFGDSNDLASKAAQEQKEIALNRSKDEMEILQAREQGKTEQEIQFIRRRQKIRERLRKRQDIEDDELKEQELANIKLLHSQLLKDEEKFGEKKRKAAEKEGREAAKIAKKVTDTKLLQLKNENEIIKAQLEGIEKEELGFLKRRQVIKIKAAEAEKETDKNRKDAALKNVKLLNSQLLEAEFEALAKKIEIEQAAMDAETEREEQATESKNKRIQSLIDENEIIKAEQEKKEKEEVAFLERRQSLRDEKREAEKLAEGQERTLVLENNRLKYEQLLAEEAEFFAQKDELLAGQAEIEQELQRTLDQLSADERSALRQKDIDELRKTLQTKAQLETKDAKIKFANVKKENALFAKEEKEHGTIVAKFRAFNRSEEFKNAQTAAGHLSQLQRSENSSLKAIGKAAALVQIGIATQKGAIEAYASFAKYGPVGKVAGVAAAAALIAFGAERAANVAGFQDGGIVGGFGGADSQLIAATPGELIVPPQNFEEVIRAVNAQRGIQDTVQPGFQQFSGEDEDEAQAVRIDVGFDGEEAADVLTIKQNEQKALGISQEF